MEYAIVWVKDGKFNVIKENLSSDCVARHTVSKLQKDQKYKSGLLTHLRQTMIAGIKSI